MTRSLSGLFLLATLGCGARAGLESPADGAGGSPSTSSSSPSSTSSSSSSSISSSTSTGNPPMCGTETMETVTVAIQRYNGDALGCASGAPVGGENTTSFMAEVISSEAGGKVVFDECPPNADCILEKTTLQVTTSGIGAVSWPIGAFVEVRLEEHDVDLGGCTDTLQIKNLPSWGGAPNPASPSDTVWFAASSAGTGFADAGYEVKPIPLGCFPDQPPGCGVKDDEVFRVTVAGAVTDVPMGASAEVGLPSWVFQNLQSYTTGFCDDSPHRAYLLFVPVLD